ncbi:hypothetical protein IF1G_11418 [Cordyceps javanica]|uniref:Uncharacterized protein n=1 Tax=Cordyceps javanica TaxID=43265 RepID=A0A545UKC6_9HYPO|nr:hypothetical protein IF1G_11418 [Cordyceps javanica]
MLTPDSPVFVDKTESRRSLAELPSVVRGHNMQTGQLDTVYTAQSALAVTGGSGDPALSVLQRMTDHLKKSLADFNEIQSPQVLHEQNVARINCILQRLFQRLREQRPEDALSIENEIIQYAVERNSLEINGLRIAKDAWKDEVAALFQALSDRLVATLQPSYFQQSLQKLAAGILEPCLLNDPEQATVKEVRDSASVGSCHEINHPAVSADGQVELLHNADESASRKRERYDQEERVEQPNKKGRSSSAVASLCQDHSDDEEGSFAIVRPDRVVEASTSPRGEVAHDEQDGIHGTVVLKIIDSDGSHRGDLRQVGIWGAKRVDSILQNPVKRPVQLRKGRVFTQVHLNSICENGVKIVSCMIQASGEVMKKPCTYCEKKNQGPFDQCIKIDDDHFRRCGNCEWVRGRCHGASNTSETPVASTMEEKLGSELDEAMASPDKPSATQTRPETSIDGNHDTSSSPLGDKTVRTTPRLIAMPEAAFPQCWFAADRRLIYGVLSFLEWRPAKDDHDFNVNLEDVSTVRASPQAWRVHLIMKEPIESAQRKSSRGDVMVVFEGQEITRRFLQFCVVEHIPISYEEPSAMVTEWRNMKSANTLTHDD